MEVLSQSLKGLSNEKVKISLLHAGVGAININDVLLASASGAIIVGFNVRPEKKAAEEAEKVGVDIRLHTVIYNVTDEIKKAMEGLLDPTLKEVARGRAEVRNTFKVPKFGVVGRLLRHRGHDPALRRRSACCATTASSTRARSARCAASRTTSPRSSRASSAASASIGTRTSRSATSSRPSRSRRSRA